jgi:uncharacterized membrane protein YhiD involved in acid resistance
VSIFNITDLSGEIAIVDMVLVMVLSFVLSTSIGWIYKITHRGTSYTQSFVSTLVLNGMVVALVMVIVGSDIARAFSLVGALSIIRFRNAVKETRDVGFIFFTVAIGMAVGTKFYLLAVIGTIFVSAVILLMAHYNWFAREVSSHILHIQVPKDLPFETLFDKVLAKYTSSSELISADTVQSGMLTELTYSVGLKKPNQVQQFLAELGSLNGNSKVTLIAGYNGTDLQHPEFDEKDRHNPRGESKMRKATALFLLAALMMALVACTGSPVEFTGVASAAEPSVVATEEASTDVNTQQTAEPAVAPVSVEYDREDLEATASGAATTSIELAGDLITIEGTGATANGSVLTITSAGTYSISGTLNDGQIVVDTQDEETVTLVLDGVELTCSTSAPIYVSNAEKTVITLADGTENTVTDGTSYVFEDAESDEPNAAIFSKDDLTINGSGSLTVNATYNNGIASKDDLKITGGTITVNAVNDGIKGRDSIAIKDGTITVNAGGDGLQSNYDEDAEKGFVVIEGGTLSITAGLDGIQAETSLAVSGGEIDIVTAGGSVDSGSGGAWGGRGMEGNANKTTESAKGLKAGTDLTIVDGVIQVDSLDAAIHSNGSITIDGGELLIASGDDGIHADSALTINGGNLNITQSYEGLESAVITINDGTIHLVASDDGINASSGSGDTAFGGQPMPGQGPGGFESGDNSLAINGGYIAVDANGDGIDANGPIEMTAGTVIVNGPTNDGNGPLDYLGTFNISGGTLVAVGSSGMAEAPSTTSTQYSVMYNFASPQAAGTVVHIETESGQEVLTFVPTKEYQSVVLSSPELENGVTYVVYSGGNSNGTAVDGVYSGGAYTAGTQVASFTISSMVTGGGATMGGFPGRPGRRP